MKIEELRAICAAATPGPWDVPDLLIDSPSMYATSKGENVTHVATLLGARMFDAQFIAQFDPIFVSKLLDLWEAAEARRKYDCVDNRNAYRKAMAALEVET